MFLVVVTHCRLSCLINTTATTCAFWAPHQCFKFFFLIYKFTKLSARWRVMECIFRGGLSWWIYWRCSTVVKLLSCLMYTVRVRPEFIYLFVSKWVREPQGGGSVPLFFGGDGQSPFLVVVVVCFLFVYRAHCSSPVEPAERRDAARSQSSSRQLYYYYYYYYFDGKGCRRPAGNSAGYCRMSVKLRRYHSVVVLFLSKQNFPNSKIMKF